MAIYHPPSSQMKIISNGIGLSTQQYLYICLGQALVNFFAFMHTFPASNQSGCFALFFSWHDQNSFYLSSA